MVCGLLYHELLETRKRAEAALQEQTHELRESGKKLKDLMESVPLGISTSTPEGQVTEINSAVVDMFDYNSKESFLEVPASAHYYDPRDRERFIELLKQGSVEGFEARFKRKDGTVY